MPRDGSGNFTLPANTQAVSGDPISSTKFNTLVQDLEADANTDRPIAAGGTGASTALAARANLGLEIGVNVQAYDAGLQSIAGLTTLADRSIYTTASDTYAVYTLTAAGRAILDDADASAQRTTLGLGTAAVKNTGTSGDAIPLLNAANTFSAAQGLSNNIALNILETGGTARSAVKMNTSNVMEFGNANNNASFLSNTVNFAGAGDLTRSGNTIWHAGNDGAGSGLDADTLDGVQGSAFALLATDNTFARNLTFSGYRNITLPTGNAAGRIQGRYDTTGGFHDHLITGVNWLRNASGSSGVIDTASNGTAEIEMVATNGGSGVIRLRTGAVNTAPTDRVVIDNSGLQARAAASTETTGTLTVASANETIQATGDITIPNAVFSAGDIILIYAGASARTLTQGSGVTMRLGGTATTGSRTLAARGVAMLFFVSSSEVIVSGGAVT